MKLPNIMGLVGVVKTFAAAHRPEILLATGATTTVLSSVLAAKGGYEARGIIDAHRAETGTEPDIKEKVQLTWLCYMPATLACTTALGSQAGLHLVHVKEKKALVTAGAVALEELKAEYKKWEKENTIGVMSNEEKQKVLEERAEKTPILLNGEEEISHVQSSDDELEPMYIVRDSKTGRDIWSNYNRVEEAVNTVNNILSGGSPVELNYFYSQAGFNTIPDGDAMGWQGCMINLAWEETVRDDGRPVRQFIFRPSPKTGFDDAHG